MRSKAGRKGLALLVSLVMVLSLFASFSSAAVTTNGVSTMDTQKKFDLFKSLGLMAGMDAKGSAGLNLKMTRAELSVVVSKLTSLDTTNAPKSATFTDVTASNSYSWAYPYVEAAAKAGYMVGVGNKKFNPAGTVKVEELATVMVNILKLKTNSSAKVSGASAWAQPYIAAAIDSKVIPSGSTYTGAALRANMIDAAYETWVLKNYDKADLPPYKSTGKKPVVSIGYYWAQPGDESVYEKFQSAFPEYEIQVLQLTPEAVAAGKVPDVFLIQSALTVQQNITSYGIQYDLMPLIKKYKDYIDLSKFDPNLINDIARYSPNGKLYGLPEGKQGYALTYNKAIFDKFGVPYPKDGMTWDEVLALSKQLTRNEGGIQYRGLVKVQPLVTQAGMKGSSDPWAVTVANVDKPKWDAVLNVMRGLYNIPNYLPTDAAALKDFLAVTPAKDWKENFIKNKTVAMCACNTNIVNDLVAASAEGTNVNWDMVTYPQMKENMGYTLQSFNNVWAMSNTVKDPEAAFRVLLWVTLGEYRKGQTRNAVNLPATTDAASMALFDTNTHTFDGKNKTALFKLKSGITQSAKVPDGVGDIYQYLLNEANTNLSKRLVEEKDNNKIINDLQELGEKYYADAKAKLKK